MSTTEFVIFVFMLAGLAALPSASVALVVARSASRGFASGVAVGVGIACADALFLGLAAVGLAALAESLGFYFAAVRMAGAVYLLWLGFGLLRNRAAKAVSMEPRAQRSGLLTSYLAGFLLTLGDIKAIAFYASVLPLFVDVEQLSSLDLAVITALTMTTVLFVKIIYAGFAQQILTRSGFSKHSRTARSITGACLVGTGSWLLFKG